MARPRGKALEKQRASEAVEREAAKVAAQRRKNLLIALGAVVVIGLAAVFVLLQPPPPGIAFEDLGNEHLPTPDAPHIPYNSSPPSSGPHFGGLANWGEASEPVPPEVFIHNLEDAGVVLAYDCPDGCDDLLAGLREVLADNENENLLMTEYQGIVDPDGVARRGAAVAWTRVLYFDEIDDETRGQIDTFIGLYEGIDHHVRVGAVVNG